MKKSAIGAAIALALSATGVQAQVFTFNDGTGGTAGTDFTYTNCNTINFKAGAEFRMCKPDNVSLGGGIPLQKDTINGTPNNEQWTFDGNGEMSGVRNTAITAGISSAVASYIDLGYIPFDSGDRNGGPGMDQGAIFFGNSFGFLAPYNGTPAGANLGAGQYTSTGASTFELFFPVLESQWGGTFFPLGNDGNVGITFFGTTSGANFSMYAEHTITAAEDPGSAGFTDWTAQWFYQGTMTSAVPVPAAVWLFGSGLLGLVGVARRKKASV